MKIAISAAGTTLDTEVDPRFGRCQYFFISDTESGSHEVIENESASLGGGAGTSTAQMIVDKGIKAVLTGSCGLNAYGVLSSSGIEIITGISGKVQDVITQYNQGELSTTKKGKCYW